MRLYLRLPATIFLLVSTAATAIVDRVAIVVGKHVVTESEVLDDLRLTEFIDNEPIDLGPAARRAGAEHLVDQELIRSELEMSGFNPPPAGEADALLRKFRQNRFQSLADDRAAMLKYGVSEDQLKRRLLWQLTAIRFIDFRFGSQQPGAGPQSADRAATNAPASGVDRRMDAWLKQARADTKIAFKPEAFQ
jgi:hypothetical protein